MSFMDHIEDLRWHLVRSLIAILIAAILVFIRIEWIFEHIIMAPAKSDFISYRFFCWMARVLHIDSLCLGAVQLKFQNTELAGQFIMSFSVSIFLGFGVRLLAKSYSTVWLSSAILGFVVSMLNNLISHFLIHYSRTNDGKLPALKPVSFVLEPSK